jgi:outer membrane lipoprotein-sorting protein
MKHSKTLLLTCAFFSLLSTPGFSQTLWDKYAKLSSLRANFKQEKEVKSLGMKLHSSGSLSFKKPDLFERKVLQTNPFGFVFKSDQIELWENGKLVKSVDSSKMDTKMLNAITHLKAWLTMDQKFVETHYSMKKLSESKYEFTPKGKTQIFKTITIETDTKSPIKRIQLVELSDDLINIEFSGTKLQYEK